jgi:uncharacterized protein (TIGR03437 family)
MQSRTQVAFLPSGPKRTADKINCHGMKSEPRGKSDHFSSGLSQIPFGLSISCNSPDNTSVAEFVSPAPSFFKLTNGAVGGVPAVRGSYVSIYCTGLGDVTNRPANGAPAPPGPPYSETLVTPTVTIGGVPATVSFSGLAPNYVGLYQVNVQVPLNAPTGTVSVTISIGGASDTVTMGTQ